MTTDPKKTEKPKPTEQRQPEQPQSPPPQEAKSLIRKATRKKSYERIALVGPSGNGKTLSSILLAYGLVGPGKFCIIDTEGGKGERFQGLDIGEITGLHQFDGKTLEYDVLPFNKPYTPERYINAMNIVNKAGYECMIIDNVTYEWSGPGGCIELIDALRPTMVNQMAPWAVVTPRHQKFVYELVNSPCHVICTMRSKTEWRMPTEGKSGKPEKVGTSPMQRDQFEYEFTLMLSIAPNHMATIDIHHDPRIAGNEITPFMINPLSVIEPLRIREE